MSDEFESVNAVVTFVIAFFSASFGYFFGRAGGNDIRVLGPPPSGKAQRVPTLSGRDSEQDLKTRIREYSLVDGTGSELDLKLEAAREEHSDTVEWILYPGSDKTCGARSAKFSLDLALVNVGDRPGVLASIDIENKDRFDKDITPSIYVEGLPITLRENETRTLTAELKLIVEPRPSDRTNEVLMRRNKLVDCLTRSPIRIGISLEVVSLRRILRSQAKYKKVNQEILLDYTEIERDSYISPISLWHILERVELLERAERRVLSEHSNHGERLLKKYEVAFNHFGDESTIARNIVEEIIDFLKMEEIMYWPTERGFGVGGPSSYDVFDIMVNGSESINLEAETFKYRKLSVLPEFKERLLFYESDEHRAFVVIRADTIDLAKDLIAHMMLIMTFPQARK